MDPATTPDTPPTEAPPLPGSPELVDELELELDEGAGLTRSQLFAIYGLLIGGAVALALYRATRKRAGEYGAGVAPLAGTPRVSIDELELEPGLRALLEHYAGAQQEALNAASYSLERFERRVAALEGHVASLRAGRPVNRGEAPPPAPAGAAVSLNAPDEVALDELGTLAAVPDADTGEAILAPAIPPAAFSTNGADDEPAQVAPQVPRVVDELDEPLGPGMRPAAVGHAPAGTE